LGEGLGAELRVGVVAEVLALVEEALATTIPTGHDWREKRWVISRSPMGGASASHWIAWHPLQWP
jgi:hypothetical protein